MILELEIKTNYQKIMLGDLSSEAVFKCFFFSNSKVVFIINEIGQLYGIITLGDFIKSEGHIGNSINKKYLFVRSGKCNDVLIEAQKIYDRYKIESDIPIIDENNIIIACVHNNGILADYNRQYELICNELKDKILNYQSSYYFKKEIDAFFEIMMNTVIYVKDCKIINELADLFGKDISKKCIILDQYEYYNKIINCFYYKNELTIEDKMSIFFDFDINYHSFLCKKIYSIEKFKDEFLDSVEKGEFSRLLRITKNPYYSLNDFIYDHDLKDITYSSNCLATKFLYDYFTSNGHPVFLDDTDYGHAIRGSWLTNGVRGSKDRADSFSVCDMVGQQIILNKIMKDKNITVFNIQGATKARLTKGENKRYRMYPNDLGILIEECDYESINQLFGEDYGQGAVEFVKQVSRAYPIIRRFERDLIVNADYTSTYINFENGIRKTFYQPEEYINTIYIVGSCLALGLFVEDRNTIPSLLAKILIENGYSYRIVNLGILISNDIQDMVDSLVLREGDIVVNLLSTDRMQFSDYMEVIYTDAFFDDIDERKDMFFDIPIHCNREGNKIYTKAIYEQIKKELKKEKKPKYKYNIYNVYKANPKDLQAYNFTEYKKMLEYEKKQIPEDKNEIGCIVMNANPFTYGHEYLIDYALKNCEWLYLFVVQENQSFFQFNDRFYMIQEGCRDKRNISVLPSGKVILSNVTLPEYFKKEILCDDSSIKQDIKTSAVLDFRLFASYIAPILEIKKRFVGNEPSDFVTREYNEQMKNVLSSFDIEVIEIPRKRSDDGEIISASIVRKLYKKREFERLRELVPSTTYSYLIKNMSKYIL